MIRLVYLAAMAAMVAGEGSPHMVVMLVDDLGNYNVGFHQPGLVSDRSPGSPGG